MEIALVRQPRGSPARSRAQHAGHTAVGVAGGALMAAAALLQPFTAPHLLPGQTPSRAVFVASSPVAATPAPAPAAAVKAESVVAPPADAAATSHLVSPLMAAAPEAPQALASNPGAAPLIPPAPPPGPGAPPPRAALPLQTDLIAPAAPAKPAVSGAHG